MTIPSDKDGSIVILDTKQYEQECLTHLTNKTFHKEIDQDPRTIKSNSLMKFISSERINTSLAWKMKHCNKATERQFFMVYPKHISPMTSFQSSVLSVVATTRSL